MDQKRGRRVGTGPAGEEEGVPMSVLEAARRRMHVAASLYGRENAECLAASRHLDELVNEETRRMGYEGRQPAAGPGESGEERKVMPLVDTMGNPIPRSGVMKR